MNRKNLDGILKKLKKDATIATLPSTRAQLEHILVTYFACPKEDEKSGKEARDKWLNALLGTVDERLKSWKDRVNGKSYTKALELQTTAREALEQMKQRPTSSFPRSRGQLDLKEEDLLPLAESYLSQAILYAPTATETFTSSEKNKLKALKMSLFADRASVRFKMGNFTQTASDLVWALKCADELTDPKATPDLEEAALADIKNLKTQVVSFMLSLDLIDANQLNDVLEFMSFFENSTTYTVQQLQAYKRYCKKTRKDSISVQNAITLVRNIRTTLKDMDDSFSDYFKRNVITLDGKNSRDDYFRYQLDYSSVEYKEVEGKGRIMVAKKAIKSGSRLLIEKPYSSVVNGAYIFSLCNFCMKALKEVKEVSVGEVKKREEKVDDKPCPGFPCDFCNEAHYCSLSCTEKAYASYHRYECGFLGFLLHGTGGSLAGTLMYRIFAKTGLKEALESWHAQKATGEGSGLELLQEYLKNTNLCSKGDWCELSPAERKLLFRMSATAVVPWAASTASWRSLQALDVTLILLTRNRDYLNEASSTSSGSFALLLDLYELAFTRIVRFEHGSDRDTEKSPGDPIPVNNMHFLLNPIVNHSCLPNMKNETTNGHSLKIATRDIKTGEELTISYRSNQIPFKKRQEELQRDYNFTCDCSLCKNQTAVSSAEGDFEQMKSFLAAYLNLKA